jgi:hypothetical protein
MDAFLPGAALGLSLINLFWICRLQTQQSTHVHVLRALVRVVGFLLPGATNRLRPRSEPPNQN